MNNKIINTMKTTFTLLILGFFCCIKVQAAIWKVGPNRTYTKPGEVSALVQDGDTVEIDAGTYKKDVVRWNKNNLLLRAVGGRAHLNAEETAYGRKAIWVINGNNTTVENIEFSNCRDPFNRDKNWAGIRQQGSGLIVRNCYFHNNDNGILGGGGGTSDLVIEFSEFAHNGYGDGYSHNLYIGNVRSLTFSYNYTHHAKVGHELKSRAMNNYILYNRIGNEENGNASREIDLPNGGVAILIGNQIQQGPNSTNSGMIGYGLEGLKNPAPHELYLINNTIVNDIKGRGSFVSIMAGTDKYKAYNNIFAGYGNILTGSAAVIETVKNMVFPNAAEAGFVNLKEYNYRLVPSSLAIDSGVEPGISTTGYDLTPTHEYVHPRDQKTRILTGLIDIGAYEYNIPVGSDGKVRQILEKGFKVIAYPNPYNDRIQFNIDSKVSGKGSLVVYSISGEKVKTVYDGYIFAASGQVVDFTVPALSRTNLIYIFTINGKQEIGKLINLR